MAKKNSTPSYVLNLKLKTEKYQEDILSKRFEIGRQLYNAVLGGALKRHKEMVKTKRWRINQENIKNIYKVEKDEKLRKKKSKEYFDIKKNMLIEFGLSEYSLHSDVTKLRTKYKKNIGDIL